MFVFGGLKSLLPKFNGIIVDNHVFRLHYRITVIILVAFIILQTAKEYIGQPIRCETLDGSVEKDILDQYCWVQSTYSLPDFWHGTVGEDIIYPGVGPYKKGKSQVFHKYYQWVVFMLFLQAVSFYVPRYLWKIWEGGKINMLLQSLNNPLMDVKEQEQKIKLLSDYILRSRNSHNFYGYGYFFCEILNFINIVGQLCLTDRFLGHEFSKFGIEVLKFIGTDQQNRTDPMAILFPRLTKCNYYKFGFGGTVENKDAICVLPLNIVNEKIYVFLWFWFIILAVVTTSNLIYRILTLVCPPIRTGLLYLRSRISSYKNIKQLTSTASFGDWLLLYLLSKNMDSLAFQEFIHVLHNNADYVKNKYAESFHGKLPSLLPKENI